MDVFIMNSISFDVVKSMIHQKKYDAITEMVVGAEALIRWQTPNGMIPPGDFLDVYEEESDVFFHDFSGHIVEDDTLARLISMPNVIVTSHQAFLTREALGNIADTTLNNIQQYFAEERCDNELCYKCVKFGTCPQEHKKKCF